MVGQRRRHTVGLAHLVAPVVKPLVRLVLQKVDPPDQERYDQGAQADVDVDDRDSLVEYREVV